jgi:predicted phage tail protein
MKRKIYLDGELGAKYGTELTMNVNSFGEVFRCLECNYPDVKQYLIDCHEKGIGFFCKVGESGLTRDEELLLQFNEGDMYISPQPAGAKSSGAKLLAAVALIAISFIIPGGPFAAFAAGAEATALQIVAATAFTVGVNLALSGIQQMLAPDPSVDNQQDDSYLFQGTGQTIVEGDPVPVLYGRLRVPGRPVSFHTRNTRTQFYTDGARFDNPGDAPPGRTPGDNGQPADPGDGDFCWTDGQCNGDVFG